VTAEAIAILALLGGLAVVVALAYRAGARAAGADRKLAEAAQAAKIAKEIEDHADRRAALEA
jgi:hypothetical protein